MTDSERLIRIEEQLKALSAMLETRVSVVERRLEAEIAQQQLRHVELQDDVDSSWSAIRDLQGFRQRLVGVSLGIGSLSGLVSGLIIMLSGRML